MLERRQRGNSTYAVFSLTDSDVAVDKVSMMMINNNAGTGSGLAPITLEEMNGNCQALLYDITGKIPLKEYLTKNISQEAFKTMMLNLVETIENFDEYMIDSAQILMDLDTVYINEIDRSTAFLCLALKGVQQQNNLYDFFKSVVYDCRNVDSVDKGISYFNRAWNLVGNESTFSLENMKLVMTSAEDKFDSQTPDKKPIFTGKDEKDSMRDDGANLITVDKQGYEAEKMKAEAEKFTLPEPEPEKKGLFGKLFGGKDKKDEKAEKPEKPEKEKKEKEKKEKGNGFAGGLAGFKKKNEIPAFSPDDPLPPINGMPVNNAPVNKAPTPANNAPAGREAVEGGTVMLGLTPPSDDYKTTMLNFSAEPEAKLVLTRVKTGVSETLTKAESIVGRNTPDIDFDVSYNNAVSRRHAKIVRHGKEFFVIDNNSTNGTFLNGRKLVPNVENKLNTGDKLVFVNEEFTVKVVL